MAATSRSSVRLALYSPPKMLIIGVLSSATGKYHLLYVTERIEMQMAMEDLL